MAAKNNGQLVRGLLDGPIHPLGPDILLYLREYCPDFNTVTGIEDPERVQEIIDLVGDIFDAVDDTLKRFRISFTVNLDTIDDVDNPELVLRRRVRDASRDTCVVIDVLEAIYPKKDKTKELTEAGQQLKALARRGYSLLENLAVELNMSVQEVQAQSVA